MRVGLFGGSFDPIHLGHVEAARAAKKELSLDRVLFLPTAQPPHKPERRFAPELARYAMVELALLDDAELRVSDVELTPGRPAYAIETFERFRAEAPEDEHVLLMGVDSLGELETWRRWRDLLAIAEIGVFSRPAPGRSTSPLTLGPELAKAIEGARVGWVDSVSHRASSSEIRRRLAAGEPLPDGWLDPRVLAFATKYALYR